MVSESQEVPVCLYSLHLVQYVPRPSKYVQTSDFEEREKRAVPKTAFSCEVWGVMVIIIGLFTVGAVRS